MNKFTIPTILAVTVLVAGIFAFMPVQQASTVHTSGTITTVSDADIVLILEDTGITIPGTITTVDTVVDGIALDVAEQDFVLSCSVSELDVLASAGIAGTIFCSVVSADTGLIDFGTLTITTVEQLDDGGGITAAVAAEIGTTDRFKIDLDEAVANALDERWCGTVSVTDGASTAEANVCTVVF